LLGANTTADVLHLTNTLTSAAGPARLHLVSGDELRVITRSDEPLFDELFPVSDIELVRLPLITPSAPQ